jgi:hypothetical protein
MNNKTLFYSRDFVIFAATLSLLLLSFYPVMAQPGCPSLKPVLIGADPLRSMNAWQRNASVVVNIMDNSGVNYAFSSREKQAIEAAFLSWQGSLLTCANLSFVRFISVDNMSTLQKHFLLLTMMGHLSWRVIHWPATARIYITQKF